MCAHMCVCDVVGRHTCDHMVPSTRLPSGEISGLKPGTYCTHLMVRLVMGVEGGGRGQVNAG